MMRRGVEVGLIAVLLVCAVAFMAYLLPVGVDAYRAEPGLGFSPRLVPGIAGAGLVLVLAFGAYDTVRAKPLMPVGLMPGSSTGTARLLVIAALCFVFAFFSGVVGGFYLGGFLLAGLTASLLGERRVVVLALFPLGLMATIYAIFELGFQLRFPKSDFLSGLPI